MVDFKSYFRPSGMKVLLSLLLLVPSFFTLAILSFGNFYIWLICGLVIAYIIGCTMDIFIKSKPVKIVIATASALVSLWLITKLLLGSISEYAHVPSESELACREICQNATNKTSEVMQKFQ